MASDAQKRANAKYFKENYSQVKLSMPNDEAEALRAYCADHGLTVAGFIRQLIREAIAPGGYYGSVSAGVTSENIQK